MLVTAAMIGTGVAAFAGECLSVSFTAGLVGNLLAAVGYDHLVKDPVSNALRTLRELVGSAMPEQNHDLLRAVWLAQENALIICYERVLLEKKGLRPGSLAIPVNFKDFDAWVRGFAMNDPEVKLILSLRGESIRRARRFEKASLEEVLRDTALVIDQVPELFKKGSEFEHVEPSDLRKQSTSFTLSRLVARFRLPTCLHEEIEAHWFDYIRVAFRETLKRYPNAKAAFEFHVWEKIDGLTVSLDGALEILTRLDTNVIGLVSRVGDLRDTLESIAEGMNAQHLQGREDMRTVAVWLDSRFMDAAMAVAELSAGEEEITRKAFAEGISEFRDAFEKDTRLAGAEKRLTVELQSLGEKLDYAIAGLPIQPFRALQEPAHDLQILQAKFRAIRLLGRDTDMASLWSWLGSAACVSSRLVIGGAGSGKTRLAFELLLRVSALLPHWRAGILTGEALRKFDATAQAADWSWHVPTLLVIDYAQTLTQPLGELLKALTHRSKDTGLPPLRILLLERQAGPWFDDLKLLEESHAPCSVADLFHPPEPEELTPLPSSQFRREIFLQTLKRAAALKGQKTPVIPLPEVDAAFDAALERPFFERPLDLMLAALVAGETGNLSALRRERIDLALQVAGRELTRIERFARDPGNEAQKRILRQMAACATIERGLDSDRLAIAVGEELDALRLEWPGGMGDLSHLLKSVLPGEKFAVAPVEPDFLGEALMLKVLVRLSTEAGTFFLRCAKRTPGATTSTLLHSFQNFGQDAEHGARLLDLTDQVITAGLQSDDFTLLLALEAALPKQSTTLRERAARITLHLYQGFRNRASSDEVHEQAAIARLAHNLAHRLSEVGRRAEALATAKEAVEIYRKLSAGNPDAFLPDLARSLDRYACRLSEVGRRSEALAPAEEAVEVLRKFSSENPDAFLHNLAGSLNNLAKFLSDVGRRAEALAPGEEAVEIYRKLSAVDPDSFLSDLANSLNNFAKFLSEVGRRVEALAPADEAVENYRKLSAVNPDAFLPNLAVMLSNLAAFLVHVGRRAEALAPAEEAVEHYRKLSAVTPDAFLPGLALSLNNLAALLSEVGRRAEALASVEEAVENYRRLLAVDPDAFLPDLARSLNNLAKFFIEVGRRAEALATAEEAAEIYRKLSAVNPDAFLPDLARSLHGLAAILTAVGHHAQALESANSSVAIRRKYSLVNPDMYLPDLAHSLHLIASILSVVGRQAESMPPAEEAVEILRKLSAVNPDVFLPDLAKLLHELAAILSEVGRKAEALALGEEAVEILRQLSAVNPDAFLPDLARSLHDLAAILSSVGHHAEALAPAEEAVDYYRKLSAADPDAFLPYLAPSLCNLAIRLRDVGRRVDALAPEEEALEIRRKLSAVDPDAYLPDLAVSLTKLVFRLSEVGRQADALALAEEEVEIRRELSAVDPDAYLPDLAVSLNNLSFRLCEAARRAEALAPGKEAVDYYRELSVVNPDTFLPDLAVSLNNLAFRLSEVGRQAEALAFGKEAVENYRKLSEGNPDTYVPNLANSMETMGQIYEANDRHTDALESFAEGLRLLREPLQKQPQDSLQLAIQLKKEYLRLAEKLEMEPDAELLAPVAVAVESINRSEGKDIEDVR